MHAKLMLNECVVFSHHRSGWAHATNSLDPLLTRDSHGVLLDTVVEMNFSRRLAQARRNKVVPYRQPWVGFVHNPPNIPKWHDYRKSPCYFFRLRVWQESMFFCRGLITLSAWMQQWLQNRVNVPVLYLKHPTEAPLATFDFERFRSNPQRRVIQVGCWLRRLRSIRELPARRIRKAILLPASDPEVETRFRGLLEREIALAGVPPLRDWGVEIIPYQQPSCYDRLLAENIVFLHLYGSVANNTIVECIVRNTPVLVNPLPSVVEYLGKDYPCYFRTLDQAVTMAEDMSIVRRAHEYLCRLPKADLSAEYFRNSLAQSDFYRRL